MENRVKTEGKKISFLAVLQIILAILIIFPIIALGENAPFLLLAPPMWVVTGAFIVISIKKAEIKGEKNNKNRSWLRLFPAAFLMCFAGSFVGMSVASDFFVPFLAGLYVVLPMIVSYVFVKKPIANGKLSLNAFLFVAVIAFLSGYGFAFS